jgi:hypothetical protein
VEKQQDVRGMIGLIAVVGLFSIVFFQLMKNIPVSIPPEVAGVVGSVVGFYFGSKGAAAAAEQTAQGVAQGVVQSAQGAKLDEIHELVNSRFEDLVEKHKMQTDTIAAQKETIDTP